MGAVTNLLLVAALAGPSVEAVSLDGTKRAGTLESLGTDNLSINVDGKSVKVPLSELMHVAFPKTTRPKTAGKDTIRVALVDGTQIVCNDFTTDGKTATLESVALGKLTMPLVTVASIRFAPPGNEKIEKKWKELTGKKLLKDYLVIDRKINLDFLDVVVAGMTKDKVTFAFSGSNTELSRTKKDKDTGKTVPRFFGIIFSREPATAGKTACNIRLTGGDAVQVSKITWAAGKLKATLLSGSDIELEPAGVSMLDFSLGKIKYLSDMEPRYSEFTPYFDDKVSRSLFRYRNNKTYLGQKLQLGNTTYDRGLWIHSRTTLTYRLNGEYRQFKAVMGIDQFVARDGKGHVRVVIKGDDKTLLETDVRGTDNPQKLNLDVSGVRDLVILVDYGDNDGTSDHLDLCEARLIK